MQIYPLALDLPDALKEHPKLAIAIAVTAVLISPFVDAIKLWAETYSASAAGARAKVRLERLKLRYEIEAIKKEKQLTPLPMDDVSQDFPEWPAAHRRPLDSEIAVNATTQTIESSLWRWVESLRVRRPVLAQVALSILRLFAWVLFAILCFAMLAGFLLVVIEFNPHAMEWWKILGSFLLYPVLVAAAFVFRLRLAEQARRLRVVASAPPLGS